MSNDMLECPTCNSRTLSWDTRCKRFLCLAIKCKGSFSKHEIDPVFTDTKPTQPGWYWWRSDRKDEHPQVVEVDRPRNATDLFMWLHGSEGGDRLFGQFGPKIPSAEAIADVFDAG